MSREQYFLFGCLIIILFYLSPYLIWDQDCLIKTGDNLDSNVVWLKVMSDNVHRLGWNYDIAPQVMNGIPKFCLGSQLNVIFLLYYFFPPFVAYVMNLFFMHFIAFFGMLLLLKMIAPRIGEKEILIIYGIALCFALLDFWPSGGLSIAGQPLLLFALLQIKNGNFKPWYFAVIVLFPFYTSLVLAGVFILLVLLAWMLYEILLMKRAHFQFYIAILLLVAFYLFSENEMLSNFFIKGGFVSHRMGFSFPGVSFATALMASLQIWLFGLASHANVFQFPLILTLILIAVFLVLVKKIKGTRSFYVSIAVTFCISIISGFYHWQGIHAIKRIFPVFKTFDLSRFVFLLPIVFFLLFFYSMHLIFGGKKRMVILVMLVFVMQAGLSFKRNQSDRTLYTKSLSLVSRPASNKPEFTYRNYYSEALFKKLRDFIGVAPEEYRVLGLGIDPAVILYNGFYTLDAYVANYPLSYKKRFRKMIARELEKDITIKRLFDDFGSTCYLYSAELGPRAVTRAEDFHIRQLQLDPEALREMGCNYIFSTARIDNPERNGLHYMDCFDDPASIWRIFLYRTG